jgi:perosamine synthetase
MSTAFIPQVEPYVTEAEVAAVSDYLRSGGWLTEFRKTQEFEAMVAEAAGTKHAIVVPSGTVAIYLSLLAAGIGPGKRVVVPNYTMVATPNAVLWAGAKPVLVDVTPDTMTLDLAKLEEIEPPDAVLYVSIGGRCGDMDALRNYCKRHGAALIEDACQAMCSTWNGKALGSFGRLGNYSFTPHKLVTTGQGGAVVTDDDDLAQRARKLKDFSRVAPGVDHHDGLGFNFKFTDVQAVIGIEQMKLLDFRVQSRRQVFEWYRKRLQGVPGVTMLPTDLSETTPWFVEILLDSKATRDALAAGLKEKGFGSRPFYPPINHQPIYSSDFPPGSFPVSEDLAQRGLWLPSSIGLSEEQVESVCTAVKQTLGAS